jgi:phytoene/squalene synthetase
LADAIAQRKLPAELLLRQLSALRRAQTPLWFGSFDALAGHCADYAAPIGLLTAHAFEPPRDEQSALIERLCTALRLIDRLVHVADARRRGKLYVPLADLDQFRVDERDLDAPVARQALRDLIRFQADRADAWLEASTPVVSTLRGWPRVFASAAIALGRAQLEALGEAHFDPCSYAPRPSRRRALQHWLKAAVSRPG